MESFDEDLKRGKVRQVSSVRYSFDADELLLVPLGDVHYGSPECNVEKFMKALDFVKKTDCKIILMGDLLEAASKSSVGAGWVEQNVNPQEQLDDLMDWFEPVKDKILLVLDGNHENRIFKSTGIDVSGILARFLGVPYGGYSAMVYLKVGKHGYTIHAQHGSSGAWYSHTKMKAAKMTATHTDADLYLYGHTHGLSSESEQKRYYDRRMKGIRYKKQYFVLTGSFLEYEGGYAERKNMHPTKTGLSNIFLDGKKWDIHVTT